MKFKVVLLVIFTMLAAGNLYASETYYMSVVAEDSEPLILTVSDRLSIKSGVDNMTISDGATSYTFENLTRLSFHKAGEGSIETTVNAASVVTLSGKTILVRCETENNCYSIYNISGMIVACGTFGSEATIDLSRFQCGTYLVKINDLPVFKALLQ